MILWKGQRLKMGRLLFGKKTNRLFKKNHSSQRGSLLIDGSLTLIAIWIPLIFLNLELIKRTQYEVVLHYGAFNAVRLRALKQTRQMVEKSVKEWIQKAIPGKRESKNISTHLKIMEGTTMPPRQIKLQLFYRYPTFLTFSIKNGMKHHLEVQSQCLF